MGSKQRKHLLHSFLWVSLTFGRVKMYKTHIKQWDLDKKNKEPEMKAIVRKNRQRADQGKRSIIRVRGQIRDFAEVVRYWDRKGVSIDELIARHTASPTSEAVDFSTPVPSPIMTPQVLAIPEGIFRCIRDYTKGSFESGAWVTTEPSLECYSIKGGFRGYLHAAELRRQCSLACKLFSRNSTREAGRTLIVATVQIKKTLLAEYPTTVLYLLRLISDLRFRKKDEVALLILRQFSDMGEVLLGSEHPLSRVCEWLTSVYTSDFNDIIIRGVESMADSLESSVGPMHMSTIYTRIQFIRRVTPTYNARIEMLQKLLAGCEKTLQPYDFRTCLIRGYIADGYISMGNYAQGKALCQRNIACSQAVSSVYTGSSGYCSDLALLAECQYALSDVESGIATLHQAIDSLISRQGLQDERVRRWLLLLEDWYLEQGFEDSAAQVRERREKILESMETD